MATKVTRRDFLNGIAIGTGVILMPGCSEPDASSQIGYPSISTTFTPPDPAEYYPPTLTGMRGSHEGSGQSLGVLVGNSIYYCECFEYVFASGHS